MNNNRTRTRETSKHITGPGGLNCRAQCCHVGTRIEAKTNHARAVRRRDRLALANDIARDFEPRRGAVRDR